MTAPRDKKATAQSFVNAAQKDLPPNTEKTTSGPIDLTADLSELSPAAREHRRRSLLSMLANTTARQQITLRKRLPALTPGLVIAIKSGPYKNRQATVKDADYIHSRALLHIKGVPEAQWIEFSQLAPMIADDEGPGS